MIPVLAYWKGVYARAFKETAFFAGRKMVLGLAISLVGLLFQWLWGLHPWTDIWKILLTVIASYSLILMGAYIWTVMRVPVSMSQDQHRDIISLKSEKQSLEERISEHATLEKQIAKELEDARKPKRSEFQEKRFEHLKICLRGYGNDDNLMLRLLLNCQEMYDHPSTGLQPIPATVSRDRAAVSLEKMERDQIVTRRPVHTGGGMYYAWQISPGLKGDLETML